MFANWKKICKNFFIWLYSIDFGGYMIYYPTMHHWQEDLLLFKEMGVKYVMFESAFNCEEVWQDKLNGYVASKMLWNPNLNVEELKQEFITYYYAGVEDSVWKFYRCTK